MSRQRKRYLIRLMGCVEPKVYGPYARENKRDRAARKIHAEMNCEDALFGADITAEGTLKAWAYTNAFFVIDEQRGEP